MRYYSEKLNKLFDSEEELDKAEDEFDSQKKEIEAKKEEKKARAKEVEDAYKATIIARKEATKIINEADKKYYDLKNTFIKDYGSFHMSFTEKDENGNGCITTSTALFDIFNNFPFLW